MSASLGKANRLAATVVQRWPLRRMSPAMAGESEFTPLADSRERLVEIVKEHGHLRCSEPVLLASGDLTHDFIDSKKALARGSHLRLAVGALLELVDEMGVQFDAVGGLTMGADQFAHGVAMLRDDVEWFSVRKKAKERGTKKRIEGAVLGPGTSVLLVDDVVTRGQSIHDALHVIRETGATVVAAVSLVDRGPFGKELFEKEGILYRPLLTYAQLGIEPVGSDPGRFAQPPLVP